MCLFFFLWTHFDCVIGNGHILYNVKGVKSFMGTTNTMREVIIPISDIVEDFFDFQLDNPLDSDLLKEVKLKQMLKQFKDSLSNRFEEHFAIIFVLARQFNTKSETELASMEDAFEDFRKQWRMKRKLDIFLNYPEEKKIQFNNDSNATPVELVVPEFYIPPSQLMINEGRFRYIVANSSVKVLVDHLSSSIQNGSLNKYRGVGGEEFFSGVWYRKHLVAWKEAKEIKVEKVEEET